MAKKPQLDVRKLKDEVAEYLKKQKWEKAADVLEQLAAAESKDMTHRLRLGDAYRRLEQVEKAITNYQHAAKVFSDEGQLIKAIGAVKIILEIDPRNAEAQKQLGEMNDRRFNKVTLESAGLKTKAFVRATAAIELDEPDDAAPAVDSALQREISGGGDEEELELDDGKPPKKRAVPGGGTVLPHRGFHGPSAIPPPPRKPSYELGADDALDLDMAAPASAPAASKAIVPPPPARPTAVVPPRQPDDEVTLDPGEPEEPEMLPDDAILEPQAEDLADHGDEQVIPLEDDDIYPAAAPPPSVPLPQKKRPPASGVRPRAASPKPRAIPVPDEITFDEEEAPRKKRPAPLRGPRVARPIADLFSDEAEEEIELLSINSEEDAEGARPRASAGVSPDEAAFDAAFGNIVPQPGATPKKVPVMKVPLFDDLSQDAFIELVNKLEYHRHLAGQLIIREGDPGRSFYVIVEGKVRIYKVGPDEKEITLAHLGEGAFFGEMALLSGAPRTANVEAEEDTELLEVTDVVLRDLAGKYPQVISSLKNFYRQRLLNNVMAISPLFKGFDPAERKAIVEKFRMKQAAASEVLIAEGRISDGLFVVLHGVVQVTTKKDRSPIELARLKEGDIFGEMSLLTRQPATATVTSQGNSILLRLPRESFQELVVTHPQILELISELNERRKSAAEAIQ
jgi:CRP-like cAMP-binding protein/tetratricopeptide (TPR) repeat protein